MKIDPPNVSDLIFKYRNNQKLSASQETILSRARKKAQETNQRTKDRKFEKDFKEFKSFL